ncbi:MAG: triose-phosphate isomerase [Rickettsiales bacterium]|nr:triose-phosphate isomerase [Pseudomonadota bacterium]MDA0966276.1 triose-phosphate isomerase [Pseudomonadota bacterium]MDG4543059.1 triose-phosphate isomerase [Rickettsiales bacterium]MDG4545257.1 triose-phosphate isomerase [Rickettsiales bacterium]MDG4547706.1 triose-phosphate isomerase [Rickettsiales bacterium]
MTKKNKNIREYPIIIANWKMNGLLRESMQNFKQLRAKINDSLIGCEIVICPPYTLLRDFAEKIPGTGIKLGAQNCHDKLEGAYTGSISAKMIRDMTCEYVIIGHSERRTTRNEGSELVRNKAEICHSQKLSTIICVGETLYERQNDLAKIVVREQVLHSIPKTSTAENTIIAYEPVWAIGTGKTPTAEQIEEMHNYIAHVINEELKQFENQPRIVYGGSTSSQNARSILSVPSVDGLLVGKASLDPDEFWKIIEATG